MKFILYLLVAAVAWTACSVKEENKEERIVPPTVSDDGRSIAFKDTSMMHFFKVEPVINGAISSTYTAPGKIAATVLASVAGASQNVVLFDNPDLASSYTALAQHQTNIHQIQQINIRQKEIELDRATDLLHHGAATGRDVLEAQTELSLERSNLANEKSSLLQYEANLKQAGFDISSLRKAPVGRAYVICDIPENQITYIQEGTQCQITFSAFPDKIFNGKVEDIADVVDNITRMVKLRVSVLDKDSRLKTSMFAQVSFSLKDVGNNITISKASLITVDGKHYVFAKTADDQFVRKQISAGQQIGDRLIVLDGLHKTDQIVTDGAIQLKGLSFGY